MRRTRPLSGLLTCFAVAVLAGGCGSDEQPAATTSEEASAPASEEGDTRDSSTDAEAEAATEEPSEPQDSPTAQEGSSEPQETPSAELSTDGLPPAPSKLQRVVAVTAAGDLDDGRKLKGFSCGVASDKDLGYGVGAIELICDAETSAGEKTVELYRVSTANGGVSAVFRIPR